MAKTVEDTAKLKELLKEVDELCQHIRATSRFNHMGAMKALLEVSTNVRKSLKSIEDNWLQLGFDDLGELWLKAEAVTQEAMDTLIDQDAPQPGGEGANGVTSVTITGAGRSVTTTMEGLRRATQVLVDAETGEVQDLREAIA